MPTFTMELFKAIEFKPNSKTVDEWIGLDDYPLFNEAHRAELNQKIIRQYWNSEIGMETISLFAFAVRRKMHMEMPLNNLLYESAEQKFDALVNTDVTTTSESEGDQTGNTTATGKSVNTNSSESTSTNLTVASDFPQAALSDRGAYATSSQDGDGTSKVKADAEANDENASTTAAKSKDNATSRTKGFQGNAAELILAKRATFLNIDARVVASLEDCFMQVWSDGSQHLRRGRY